MGQIARACAVFCVDEVVIFDDGQAEIRAPEHGGYTAFADPNFFSLPCSDIPGDTAEPEESLVPHAP